MADGKKVFQQEETVVWGQNIEIKSVENEQKILERKVYIYIYIYTYIFKFVALFDEVCEGIKIVLIYYIVADVFS